jgi:hypothetical protein
VYSRIRIIWSGLRSIDMCLTLASVQGWVLVIVGVPLVTAPSFFAKLSRKASSIDYGTDEPSSTEVLAGRGFGAVALAVGAWLIFGSCL